MYTISPNGSELNFTSTPRNLGEIVEAVRETSERCFPNRTSCAITGLAAQIGYIEPYFITRKFPEPTAADLYKDDSGLYRVVVCKRQSPYVAMRIPGVCYSLNRHALAISPLYLASSGSITKLFFNIPMGGLHWLANLDDEPAMYTNFIAANWASGTVLGFLRPAAIPRPEPYDTKKYLVAAFGERIASQIMKEIER